jgi:hypothetical protein
MVKAYLRYEQAATWGVISSAGGCSFDTSGRLLASACLESVGIWSLKQGAQARACVSSRWSRPQQPSQKLTLSTQVKSLLPASSGSPSAVPPQVTVIERAPASNRLAVGYSDGSARPCASFAYGSSPH